MHKIVADKAKAAVSCDSATVTGMGTVTGTGTDISRKIHKTNLQAADEEEKCRAGFTY